MQFYSGDAQKLKTGNRFVPRSFMLCGDKNEYVAQFLRKFANNQRKLRRWKA